MDAICLQPHHFELVKIPVPEVGDDDILLKVICCGICGSDMHFLEGNLADLSQYPIYPGHEVVGRVSKVGKDVKGFNEDDRCVVDPMIPCHNCFFCHRSAFNQCERVQIVGVGKQGGFTEYISVPSRQVHKIHSNITDEDATLIEPTSCVIHAIDKLALRPGFDALVLGAGQSGQLFARMLKLNGATKVVLAANKGVKMDKARELNTADEYVEFDRENPDDQWASLKQRYQYGFDAVIEATGSEKVVNEALKLVRKTGALMLYSIYSNDTSVNWAPSNLFQNEIRVIGSMAQSKCFARAVAYLDSGAVNVKGMVTHVYPLREFRQAVETLKKKESLHVVVASH